MRVAVRRINEWDGPAMLKIYNPYVGTPAAPEQSLPDLQDYVRRIDQYTYGLGWIMCEIDTIPAGFCHLTEDRTDPENLFSVELQMYVKPQALRRGVGSALWSLIRDMMEYGNRRRVVARLSKENSQARDFFAAMGFVPQPSGEGDDLIMVYTLAPKDPAAVKPIKPYLIENLDYEAAREHAATLVKEA